MSAKNNINKNYKKASSQPMSENMFFIFSSLLIIVFTTCIYFKSLNNPFTRWDDSLYITENPDITTLHGDSLTYTLKHTFSSYVQGNYHPLTMLSFCLEYNIFKLNSKAYHISNLILHLLNALLVFYFIWLITKQRWVAFITALLFAIHPMHVESIAWSAERKDVLYSFFYLSAICTYIFYLKKEKWNWHFYVLTFLLFILAILSKAMAVSLPIAFFAIDYFLDRKIMLKTILEKVPFFVLSFIFGYIAMDAQKSINAMTDIAHYNFFDQILFSSYALITYIWKLILPIHLSCFYNYPVKENGVYPIIFYIAPLLVFVLAFLIYKSQKIGKDILFGFAFFMITIALVLQIIPVGAAIIADRYTYLPYIGLFFILARWLNNLLDSQSEKLKSFKITSIAAFILFVIICCYLTFQRCKVWHDSLSLWNDAIEKYDKAPLSFNCRGGVYYYTKDYDKALKDFSRAVQLKSDYSDAYYNRGLVYNNLGKYDEAIQDYSASIKYRKQFAPVYYYRGNAYYNRGKYDSAIADFNLAIQLKYTDPNGYYNRGLIYYNQGKHEDAIKDFTSAIQLNPNFYLAYSHRGMSNYFLGKYEEAIKDQTSAIQCNPTFAEAYHNRAGAYFILQKFQPALEDALKAKQLGYNVDTRFIDALQAGIKNSRK